MFIFSCASGPLHAGPQKPRPKIGVALEGGAALGLAHIGVLDWLEQNHIPVDYVAGASMGGLIGGLYAAGKQPRDLQTIVDQINWNLFLAGSTPYEDLAFRRKEDARRFPNAFELGYRNGLTFPVAFNSGQQVTFLIDRETLPYSSLPSFDQLPIPFRCVATDLVTGKQRVFSDGPIGEALRATMSIPGIFSPVRDGEHVYADGGLLDNLPTGVVRQMGADIVIAVHLATTPVKAGDLGSVFDVLGRSVSVVLQANEVRSLEQADIVITVNLEDFSSTDYTKADKIIQRGREDAAKKSALLTHFRLDDAEWSAYLAAREARRITAPAVLHFVGVNVKNIQLAQLMQKSLSGFVGKPFDADRLESALEQLNGTGRFTRLSYALTQRQGQTGLLILADEKPYANATIKPGFEVNGSDSSNIGFTLGARLTLRDLGGFRSEWRNDLTFGSVYSLTSEYYRPFAPFSRWFIAPRIEASSSALDLFSNNKIVAEYRKNEGGGGIDLGFTPNRFSEFRFGYDTQYLAAEPRIGQPLLQSVRGRVGDTTLRYALDRRDEAVIPSRGFELAPSVSWYDSNPGALHQFPAAQLSVEAFLPLSEKGTLFFNGSGGSTLGRENTGFPLYSLGGPQALAAYGVNEFLGDQFEFYRVGYLRELFQFSPLFGKRLYLDTSYEIGKMYGTNTGSKLPNDVTAGLLADTIFGPLFIGGSVGDSGHRKIFFQLGRIF